MVKRKSIEPEVAAIDSLGAITPESDAERAMIDQMIGWLVRRSRKTGVQGKLFKKPEPEPAAGRPRTLSERSPFYGLGLQLAAPKQLQIAGVPLTPRDIWAALDADGFQSAHNDPVSAVRNALKRRMNTHGDVFLVGEGKWARKDFYTEEQLVEIRKSVGGMGGRDKIEHSRSTKAGMIVALQRGVKIGKPKWFTDEREAEFIRRFKAGETVAVIAESWGRSANMIRNNFPRSELKRLREEALREEADANGKLDGAEANRLRIVK